MKQLCLVVHHYRVEVAELATRASQWCSAHGVELVVDAADADVLGWPAQMATRERLRASDVCLSLGGDGTILRAVELVGAYGVPIIGLNAGHLGYLTEFDPSQLTQALDAWRNDQLYVDERMLLELTIASPGATKAVYALNELVVERAESGHTVRVDVAINGKRFVTYLADGLIVSTPTGSTAYSLSAGGPIVEPTAQAMLLTPVAAHMVFDRTMVLDRDSTLELGISGYRDAVVTVDGRQIARLEPGQSVRCRRAVDARATFLVTGERDFHAILKEKFGLSDR